MNSHTRYYRASRDKIVRIAPATQDLSRWGVWLNGQLLCDRFGSAEDAAFGAHKKNFSTSMANELFGGVYVPADIDQWLETDPYVPLPAVQKPTSTDDCRNRHGRFGPRRL